VGDEGEGFGCGATDDGIWMVGNGLDEEGGCRGADRTDRFCEVESGNAPFVAEAFDHLLKGCLIGFGVEGFVDDWVAYCFVKRVGFFGIEAFGCLGHEGRAALSSVGGHEVHALRIKLGRSSFPALGRLVGRVRSLG